MLGKVIKTQRGFEQISFDDSYLFNCSLQQSSAIDEESKNIEPGNSYIWLGKGNERMHLDRKQVEELVAHLQGWLDKNTFNY